MKDSLKAVGRVCLTLRGPDGELKSQHTTPNLVVDSGLAFLASAIKTGTTLTFGYMAVGTGSTAAAAGDTALETELTRAALTSSTVSANQFQAVWNIAAGTATGALTEAGLFSAAVAGTMFSRVVFSVINKGALDTLSITWTVTVS